MSEDNVVIGSIIVTGKGSAHPKLGVKKKNDLETNTQILDDMITSGKLALDHALARTRKGGALRGHFGCRTDAAMDAHVDALHAFLFAWKRRLVPDWDPAAPAPAPAPKPFEPRPPVIEAAKSGKAACRQCGGLIPAGELRCGLSAYMKGTVAVTWSHAGCFPACLSFQVAPDNRAKCKATGEKIEKGSLRLCARVASNDELASGAEKSKSFFKVPALADFLRRLAPWTTPAAIAGYASLEPDDRATVDAAFAAPVTVAGVAFQANLDAAFAAYDAAAPPLSPPSFAAHDAAPPVSPPS